MEETTLLELSNGEKFTLKPLTALDTIKIEDETKKSIAELAKENPNRFGLMMAWRAAVRGGFDMPFEKFAERIPLSDIPKISAAVAQLMGNASSEGQEPSS